MDALPWWHRRMYIEGINEEFRPPDEDTSEYAEPRSYRDTTPEPTFEPGPLDPETEERVRRQSERFKRAAPVPMPGSADHLATQGYTVRTVD